MATFMETKSMNPRLRQDQIAKELGCSNSPLQRCRQDKKMLSPYRNPSNSKKKENKRFQIVNMTSKHLNWPQMTSKDPNWPQKTSIDLKIPQLTSKDDDKTVSRKVKTKANIKGGDSNDIHNHGRDLIGQAFSSRERAEFTEFIKKILKFKTK